MKSDIRRRDGLARSGSLTHDGTAIAFPAAVDIDMLFPSLRSQQYSNVPLCAKPDFVATYLEQAEGITTIHPAGENAAKSGDCVMAANWHTVMENPRQYVDYLENLKQKTPPDTIWYSPAAALPSNATILSYSGFDLFDYRAVDLKSAQHTFCTTDGEFPKTAMETAGCGCEGCRNKNLKEHNRRALDRECATVRAFIAAGQIRELADARCRLFAPQVAILRHLDARYGFMEPFVPVVRSGVLRANSAESIRRVEVVRFMERVAKRYIPPAAADVAVLLPCSAKKPYSLSQSHRAFQRAVSGRAHELIVTSPLGIVPRELETVYPAMHYDVPVTGYWDAEECAVISAAIARYFEKHRYRRVIAHLEGGAMKVAETAAEACGITLECSCRENPAGSASLDTLDRALAGERRLRDDRLHGICSYQFGMDISTKGFSARGTFPELFYSKEKFQYFSIDSAGGMLRPTFDGWSLIPQGYRVTIDDFIPEGDILVPGIVSADPEIREGDEVLVTGPRAIATGRSAMSAGEMERSGRGVAVRVRKVKKL
jgi:archaeosine synthase